jgi:hypothetical protein
MAPVWRPTPGRARAVVCAGLAVMAGAGWQAGRYRPNPFDPDDGLSCRFSADGCPTPEEVAAALRSLWWWVGAGGVVLLAGVALTVWQCAASPRGRSARGLAAPAHAVVAGVAGGVLIAVLAFPMVLALLTGAHMVPAAVATVWLLQAVVIAGFDGVLGSPSGTPRRGRVTGLVVSAAACAVAIWAAVAGGSGEGFFRTVAVVDGTVVALGVLLARLLADRRATRGTRATAAAVLTAAVVPVVLLGLPGALEPDPASPPVARPTPVPEPPPTSAPAPPPASTSPSPPAVAADVPCAADELRFEVLGFDAALGARAASIRATNVGARPCWVERAPVVRLTQGGRPLDLTVEPGRSPDGGPALAQRVGVAPGGTALALLTWRTYAGWADASTPQSLTVALGAGAAPSQARIVAPPGAGPAPFDLADGGTWGVAPWAPPWN